MKRELDTNIDTSFRKEGYFTFGGKFNYKKDIHSYQIMIKEIPKESMHSSSKKYIDRAFGLKKCYEPYGDNLTGCPANQTYISCKEVPPYISDNIDKENPILICCRLSFNKDYDNKHFHEVFEEGKKARKSSIYKKLHVEDTLLWDIIRTLLKEPFNDEIFCFGPCRFCKSCNGEKCVRRRPIFSMERSGVLLAPIVKDFLGFDLQWLKEEEVTGRLIRPQYLCSVFLVIRNKPRSTENFFRDILSLWEYNIQKLDEKEIIS
jgi:predicted metal-binding protein